MISPRHIPDHRHPRGTEGCGGRTCCRHIDTRLTGSAAARICAFLRTGRGRAATAQRSHRRRRTSFAVLSREGSVRWTGAMEDDALGRRAATAVFAVGFPSEAAEHDGSAIPGAEPPRRGARRPRTPAVKRQLHHPEREQPHTTDTGRHAGEAPGARGIPQLEAGLLILDPIRVLAEPGRARQQIRGDAAPDDGAAGKPPADGVGVPPCLAARGAGDRWRWRWPGARRRRRVAPGPARPISFPRRPPEQRPSAAASSPFVPVLRASAAESRSRAQTARIRGGHS